MRGLPPGWQLPLTLSSRAVSTMLREKMLPNSKRQRRWLPYAAIALALTAVSIAIIYSHQRLSIDPRQVALPADGAEHAAFRIRLPWPSGNVTQDTTGSPSLRLLESEPAVIEGILQAPVNPGHAQLHLL